MRRLTNYIICLSILALFVKCKSKSEPYPSLEKQRAAFHNRTSIIPLRTLDSAQIVHDLEFLSSDSCQGRQPGLPGHQIAVDRILLRLREAGLDSFHSSLLQPFVGKPLNRSTEGKNIIGWVKGTTYPDKHIVISAHYDHLGFAEDADVFNGASDNATGTACLLAMAKHFKQNPHSYSLIFAFFDREESGTEGSEFFVNQSPADNKKINIQFNLNIDMIARNDKNELFACGIIYNPSLIYLVEQTQPKTNAKILMGHDDGESRDNWTRLGDHYPFHQKKIPFLYLGVEDHPDYHKATDTFDKIDLSNYIENCNACLSLAKLIKL